MDTASPITQQVRDIFDEWARQGRGDRMAQGHWPTASQILNKLNIQQDHHFLDVGCGNGYTVAWASTQVGPQGKAVGVDISPEMVTQAQLKHQHLDNVEFLVASADALPFANNTFDWVINIESLYYYADIPKALAEIRRILKPGGTFVAMVDFYRENPYSACWSSLLDIPMAYLSEAEYKTQFKNAGLTAVRTERLFNPTPVDSETFQPGWGYETPEDVVTFRQKIGSLAIWGEKPAS